MADGNVNKQWERARSKDQIKERRESILQSAEELFLEKGLEGINLSVIARGLNMTRTNIYRYFKTREEIFLALFSRDLFHWIGELQKLEPPSAMEIEEFTEMLLTSLSKETRFLELIPHLSLTLESNSSFPVLKEFKEGLLVQIGELAKIIRGSLPWMSEKQILLFLNLLLGFTAGLYPMGNFHGVQEEVMNLPHLAELKVEFLPMMRQSVIWILKGMKSD